MTKRLLPDPGLEALIRRLNDAAAGQPPLVEADEPVAALGSEDVEEGGAARRATATPGRFRLPEANPEGRAWLDTLVAGARARHASDLHLVAGAAPTLRVNGALEPLGDAALSAGAAALLAAALVPAGRRAALEETGTLDFLVADGAGAMRGNVHRERDGWAAAVRLLPEQVLDLEALHLPPALERFADLVHGLVLVVGPPGAGKTTTLAALVKRILARRRVHLITIEDPVEYRHPHGTSVVEHVEIGRDAPSFAAALRSALRQDPDVLLIGEMRDSESMAISVTAADTGRLVLSTLHTADAPQTVHRILDSAEGGRAGLVRSQLASSLVAIVSQQLLPRRDGRGRVPAVEILVATDGVRNLVRQGHVARLRSQITLESAAGMLSLDRSLARLVRSGLVDPVEARRRARVPEEFDGLLRDAAGPA